MSLLDINGNRLFQYDFRHREGFIPGRFALSAGGQRFAISLIKWKGGVEALDISPHYSLSRIMVYDLAAGGWVYALDGEQQKIKSISALALSPSGSLLGLINQDGVLEVYSLP